MSVARPLPFTSTVQVIRYKFILYNCVFCFFFFTETDSETRSPLFDFLLCISISRLNCLKFVSRLFAIRRKASKAAADSSTTKFPFFRSISMFVGLFAAY